MKKIALIVALVFAILATAGAVIFPMWMRTYPIGTEHICIGRAPIWSSSMRQMESVRIHVVEMVIETGIGAVVSAWLFTAVIKKL